MKQLRSTGRPLPAQSSRLMTQKVQTNRQNRKRAARPREKRTEHPGRGNLQQVNIRRKPARDYSLILIILFFVAFGLVMLYSTSSYEAALDFGDSAYYLKRQSAATAVGLAVMLVVSRIPLAVWERCSGLIYAFSIVLLLLVVPFGTEANGAKRWIYIGPVSVQPAEISKFAVLLVTAVWLCQSNRAIFRSAKGFGLTLLPAVAQATLIYLITRNMSSAIIVMVIALGMVYVTDEHYRRYLLLFLGVAAIAVAAVFVAVQTSGSLTFRFKRILVWLDPVAYADDTGYQVLQGLYGVGSGGIFGKGLGQSMQKLGYIPEAQNDMIFSIICEELGLFGAISIILLFMLLCWRFMMVAMNASSMFGSLLAIGVMTHIAVQVILNIAVVTNAIPNTGVTFPFFSYGGSSIVILMAEIGLVLNVARANAAGDR